MRASSNSAVSLYSCKFTITMFGFEPAQRDLTASGTSASFDLTLQTHATLAVEPAAPTAEAAGAPTNARPRPRRREDPAVEVRGAVVLRAVRAAADFPVPRGLVRGWSECCRDPGGRGGGRGFQNLSLIQNGDNALDSGDIAPSLNGAAEDPSGSNEAFLVNGSLSQGVQAQANDNFGLGGPGGFNPNGFGNQGGNPFGGQNPNGDGGNQGFSIAGGGGPGGPVVPEAEAVVAAGLAAVVAAVVAAAAVHKPIATRSSATGSIAGAAGSSPATFLTR